MAINTQTLLTAGEEIAISWDALEWTDGGARPDPSVLIRVEYVASDAWGIWFQWAEKLTMVPWSRVYEIEVAR